MASLTSTQRSVLERAIIEARRLSFNGANHALKAFAVHNNEPYSHMSPEDKDLRNELRSKARLLGDQTTADGGHTINKLAYELAYEYWHQMLFARFLEANRLLMHPEHKIAVTLEECEELGKEEGYEDKWQAAAYYASMMLPAIFRQDDPLMQIKYATEDRIALEQVIEGIDADVFTASDSIGWVYQYWQTEEKVRVNKSGDPITGETISAVTQLFTEPYMVHFLIDNTLGAWWTARNPGVTPPITFEYLRTLDDGSPAAGSFDGWPDHLSKVTVLEPCMGSGHFLVEIFIVMAHLRMHDEGLTKEQACDAVIRENIHGLELDPRCTQIAAFNLALTAWKFCGAYRELPEMNLACCGLAPEGKKSDWTKLADKETDREKRGRLKGGLDRMFELFQQAPELGSLIDPTSIKKDAFTSDFNELSPFLDRALTSERNGDVNERVVIAAGVAKAGALLTKKYTWQITNVPFLGSRRQSQEISSYLTSKFAISKHDVGVAFLHKALNFVITNGTVSIVIQNSWVEKPYFLKFREWILNNTHLSFIGFLGTGAFETISGEVVNVCLPIINRHGNLQTKNTTFLDASDVVDKKKNIIDLKLTVFSQDRLLGNPNFIITPNTLSRGKLLSKYCKNPQGIKTGDDENWVRKFWELNNLINDWEYCLSTPAAGVSFSGREKLIRWGNGNENFTRARYGSFALKKCGVALSQTGNLNATIYDGVRFDSGVTPIVPVNSDDILAVYTFCSSNRFVEEVRKISSGLYTNNSALLNVHFDLIYWDKIAKEKYPNGLPKPYSDDPTQWLFHGHPLHALDHLQVTIARLLGYTWPAENDEEMKLSEEAQQHIQSIHNLELPFDEDGIVCIPSVAQEAAASDRIRDNIKRIWGDDYSTKTISDLIVATGSKKRDLASYLRDDFFEHHVKLFKNRPFIWHIWDGRKDGFSALVNYHKLDRATLEKLIFTYLGDWINQCDRKMKNQVSGADGLLSAARKLKEQLILILDGEPPYDTFIRWKSAVVQSIGWNPDLNDGVRLNIQPFIQANILRKNLKSKIKRGKDRGKNPNGSHWGPERHNTYEELEDQYKLRDEKGNIIPHLTNAVKRKLRDI